MHPPQPPPPPPPSAPQSKTRTYEEYAYVLGPTRRGRSHVVRSRGGLLVTVIGENKLALLEVLGEPGAEFHNGERLCIGKTGRTKITSVMGKISYEKLSDAAKDALFGVVTTIVTNNEKRFVEYLNSAGPITPRIHALELIPGIGKTYMNIMIDERERRKFDSYKDLQERVGLNDPAKHIAERIVSEIDGRSRRMSMFAKR